MADAGKRSIWGRGVGQPHSTPFCPLHCSSRGKSGGHFLVGFWQRVVGTLRVPLLSSAEGISVLASVARHTECAYHSELLLRAGPRNRNCHFASWFLQPHANCTAPRLTCQGFGNRNANGCHWAA